MSSQTSSTADLAHLPGAASNRKRVGLLFVYLTVFIDMLGASLVIPVLPFYALEFGASSLQVGFIFAIYNGCQMVSGLVAGRASDVIGRRPTLLLSLCGSTAGFFFQGMSTSIWMLLAARGVSGLFGGSPPVAQSYVADVSTEEERPRLMALVGSTIGAAFLFGPGIGAGLAEFSLNTPMFVASGLSATALCVAWFYLPESRGFKAEQRAARDRWTQVSKSAPAEEGMELPRLSSRGVEQEEEEEEEVVEEDEVVVEEEQEEEEQQEEQQEEEQQEEQQEEERVRSASLLEDDAPKSNVGETVRRATRLILAVTAVAFLNQFAFMCWLTMYGLYIAEEFGLGSLALGFIISATSLVFIMNQTIAYNKMRKRIGTLATGFIGSLLLTVALYLLTVPPSIGASVPPLFLLAIGYGFVTPAVPTLLSSYANEEEQGKVLGYGQASEALARVVGPLVLGELFDVDPKLPFYVAAAVSMAAALMLLVMRVLAGSPKESMATAVLPGSDEYTPKDEKRLRKHLGEVLFSLLSQRQYKMSTPEERERIYSALDTAFPDHAEESEVMDEVLGTIGDASFIA